jgi:hypothetical protein
MRFDGEWFSTGILVGMVFCWVLLNGCADEMSQRKRWQDCGGVAHEECYEPGVDHRQCEYEYYVVCVYGDQGGPDGS